jgi:solute carrier family 20 (sodium-dependent phosphate transporter)
MMQVGVLAIITEFIGAVALGAKVTNTIKNGIIDSTRFHEAPATLMLVMGSAEVGSATWLILATKLGFPVSTTQTIIGAIIGAGIASGAPIHWGWQKNSVSQIAASWFISPLIAALCAIIIFASIKFCILERNDPFKKAMRAIPIYLAFTAAILALFMVVEAPNLESLEVLGAGKICGIIFAVLFGMLVTAYVFFRPFFIRRLIKKDPRVRFYHIPLGPYLLKDNPWLYFPASEDRQLVIDYYQNSRVVRQISL